MKKGHFSVILFFLVMMLNSNAQLVNDLNDLKNRLTELEDALSGKPPVSPLGPPTLSYMPPQIPVKLTQVEQQAITLLKNVKDILRSYLQHNIEMESWDVKYALRDIEGLFNLSPASQAKINLPTEIKEIYKLVDQLERNGHFPIDFDPRIKNIINKLNRDKVVLLFKIDAREPLPEDEMVTYLTPIHYEWDNNAQIRYYEHRMEEIYDLIQQLIDIEAKHRHQQVPPRQIPYPQPQVQPQQLPQQPQQKTEGEEEETEELECPICFEEIEKGEQFITTGCKKCICKTCWESLKAGSARATVVCPFCRAAESRTKQYEKKD